MKTICLTLLYVDWHKSYAIICDKRNIWKSHKNNKTNVLLTFQVFSEQEFKNKLVLRNADKKTGNSPEVVIKCEQTWI